ncbi:MAG: ribbon-helix-helix protein, CopG family [Deltaproteobacteria bacterium]|nr:ribbon-helix-helix protein, CopG family [Deltaproteobacteria bacterium]
MNTATITIKLDRRLNSLLNRASRMSKRPRSEVVKEALRRQLSIDLFRQARRRLMPFAEAKGYLTDEDVFRDVS